jgi:hypothetical protein
MWSTPPTRDDIDVCSDNKIIGNTVINAAESGIHLDKGTQADGSSSGVTNRLGRTISTNCVGI